MACRADAESAEILEELELLQAIYIHELVLEGPVERPSSLTLLLHPSTGDDDPNLKFVCLSLCLKIPAEYPFMIPEISIQNPRGLSDAHINSIQENLFQLAKEKAGSPMLYDLIEYTKECLSDNNIPSCPCVICLEHFHEGTKFQKTNCYHYFHLLCLRKYVEHFLCENEKVFCPMCRLEIEFDRGMEETENDGLVPDEEFVYKPDEKQQKAQIERQKILDYQIQKGGTINIEEERNKYLIEIKDIKKKAMGEEGNLDVNSRSENRVTGKKDENFNSRKEELGQEETRERENTIEGNKDQDRKNKVNNRNNQTNRNKTSGKGGKDEVSKGSYHEQAPRGSKNKNPEKRDRVCQRGSEKDHKGRREHKTQGMISRKEERTRDAFPSSRKQENNANEKYVKDFERKDRSFQSRGQKRVNDKDKGTRGRDGTDGDKTDCKPLTPPSSGVVEGRQVNISVSTEGLSDVPSKSVQTKRSDHSYRSSGGDGGGDGDGDGAKNDSKVPRKNVKKRYPRKPRQDFKNSPKASETHPSRDSNSSAATSKTKESADTNERKLPQNLLREKRSSQVRDNQPPPLRRPPPGFEAVASPPGFEAVVPPPGFEAVAPPPGFERVTRKNKALL